MLSGAKHVSPAEQAAQLVAERKAGMIQDSKYREQVAQAAEVRPVKKSKQKKTQEEQLEQPQRKRVPNSERRWRGTERSRKRKRGRKEDEEGAEDAYEPDEDAHEPVEDAHEPDEDEEDLHRRRPVKKAKVGGEPIRKTDSNSGNASTDELNGMYR